MDWEEAPYFYFYPINLKGRKQSVKSKGIRSLLQLIKSGVSQGSILGPILLNIFMNDLFCILQTDLQNVADGNTISAVIQTISLIDCQFKLSY